MAELFNMERVMGFCEKICYFFVVNLLFVCSNLPVLLFLLFVGISEVRACLPLFLFCLAFLAPALSAVFYAMNRLLRGTESGPLRDYRKGYRMDFWQKLRLGFGQMLVVLILWTNVEFAALQIVSLPLTILFALLFAAAVLVTPHLYLLASRYEMTNLQTVRAALLLMGLHPVLTLGNAAALALMLAAWEVSAGTTVLFAGSVYGFLVVFMNQKVLRDLESQES